MLEGPWDPGPFCCAGIFLVLVMLGLFVTGIAIGHYVWR